LLLRVPSREEEQHQTHVVLSPNKVMGDCNCIVEERKVKERIRDWRKMAAELS
jgi:hypothetical protein